MAEAQVTLLDPQPGEKAQAVVPSDLDCLLTAQLAVAWAGEKGEERRLGWWDSELGGEDLFQQILRDTGAWATMQAAHAAAL